MESVNSQSRHPYTVALTAAAPVPRPAEQAARRAAREALGVGTAGAAAAVARSAARSCRAARSPPRSAASSARRCGWSTATSPPATTPNRCPNWPPASPPDGSTSVLARAIRGRRSRNAARPARSRDEGAADLRRRRLDDAGRPGDRIGRHRRCRTGRSAFAAAATTTGRRPPRCRRGSAMAATWDEDLLRRVGDALAAEAVRKGVDVLLGPTINLHRSPLAGRNFECFSEDPLLSGRLATAYVRGLQEHGIGACPKHYVANDAETDRMTVDNRVDERTLHELYLAPFEAVVAGRRAVDDHGRLQRRERRPDDRERSARRASQGQLGLTKASSSRTGAPCTTASPRRGRPPIWSCRVRTRSGAEALVEAVRAGRVAETDIDAKVRRLLLLAARTGRLEGKGTGSSLGPATSSAADAAALAREAAAAAAVLVSNDGILPLELENIGRVAILGPGARNARPLGGGSAIVFPPYLVTPFAGLAAALDGRVEVVTAAGTDLVGRSAAGTGRRARPRRRRRRGDGPLARRGRVRWSPSRASATTLLVRMTGEVPPGAVALDLECGFVADEDGEWQLGVSGFGAHELQLDGTVVLEERWPFDLENPHAVFSAAPEQSVPMLLRRDQEVTVRLRFTWNSDAAILFAGLAVRPPRLIADEELAHAVELARTSDVAVVVVGTSEAVESEGMDRTSLALPGRQDELVRAVAAANPRTVVVVNAGAPVEMPWRNEVAAVLLVWFPGMEFGNALADVLLGTVEPGGRLPTTWPAAMAEAPILGTTPTDGRLDYTEGLHIGHRAYLADGVAAGLLVRARSRLHDVGVRVHRRVAPGHGDGLHRHRAAVEHRRPARQAGRSGLRVPPGLGGRPAAAVARRLRRRPRRRRRDRRRPGSDIRARSCGTGTSERHAWSVEPGRPRAVHRAARRRHAGLGKRAPAVRRVGGGVVVTDAPHGAAGRAPRRGRSASARPRPGCPGGCRTAPGSSAPTGCATDNGWDTGWVDSDQQPAGALRRAAAVRRRSGCSGRSRCAPIWARAPGRRRPGSRPGCCAPRTGSASWIEPGSMPDGAPGERPAALLRFEFDVDRPVVAARLHATAHGLYEAFLNGERAGDAELTPGFTQYDARLQVQTIDVTGVGPAGAQRDRRDPGRRLVPRSDRHHPRRRPVGRPARACSRSCTSCTTTARSTVVGTGPRLAQLRRPRAGRRPDRRRAGGPRAGCRAAGTCPASTTRPGTTSSSSTTATPGWSTRRRRRCAGSRRSCRVSVTRLENGRQIVDLGQNINGWMRLPNLGPAGHDDHADPRRVARPGRRRHHRPPEARRCRSCRSRCRPARSTRWSPPASPATSSSRGAPRTASSTSASRATPTT